MNTIKNKIYNYINNFFENKFIESLDLYTDNDYTDYVNYHISKYYTLYNESKEKVEDYIIYDLVENFYNEWESLNIKEKTKKKIEIINYFGIEINQSDLVWDSKIECWALKEKKKTTIFLYSYLDDLFSAIFSDFSYKIYKMILKHEQQKVA